MPMDQGLAHRTHHCKTSHMVQHMAIKMHSGKDELYGVYTNPCCIAHGLSASSFGKNVAKVRCTLGFARCALLTLENCVSWPPLPYPAGLAVRSVHQDKP